MSFKTKLFITLLALSAASGAYIFASNAYAQAKPRAQISSDGIFRYILSNGLPNHKIGNFPNADHPYGIKTYNYRFRVSLTPKKAAQPRPLDGSAFFGVSTNGIPFDAYSENLWNNDPLWPLEALHQNVNIGVDSGNGHTSRNSAFIYRGIPKALVKKPLSHVGYAADGFPIFVSEDNKFKSSYRLKQGNRPNTKGYPQGSYDGRFATDYVFDKNAGNLDQCNGTIINNKYYIYILTPTFPYIPRCWSGAPDKSFSKASAQRPIPVTGPDSTRIITDHKTKTKSRAAR